MNVLETRLTENGQGLTGWLLEYFLVSPTLLRVVRVARVGRVLRLVKGAKGIRTLLFSFAVSLPALFNIALLLFLVIFIYAIFGMSFFRDNKIWVGLLDDTFNFQTFPRAFVTLFPMTTSAAWDGVLSGLVNQRNCDPDFDCGNHMVGVMYLVTYLIMTYLVIVNMYIAVILENFSKATEEEKEGLCPEDFDDYYDKWALYDPDATQYITLSKLSDFINLVGEPLGLHKPNHFFLVKLDIPIYEGDLLFCRDILDALTKNFLGTGDESDLPAETDVSKNKVEYEIISSTHHRQREHHCARVIQRAFRNYKIARHERATKKTLQEGDEYNTDMYSPTSDRSRLLMNDEDKENDSDTETEPMITVTLRQFNEVVTWFKKSRCLQ